MRKLKLLLATCALLGGAFSANAQTNIIADWDGGNDTSSPSNFGWTSSANRTLQPRNNNGGIRMTTTYSGYTLENGTSYSYSASSDPSSVIFWLRYNTSGESFTYTFQGLEPNYYYDFSALVGWHNNSSNPTMTVVLNDGTNTLATMSKAISTKQKLYSVSSRFKTPSTITNTTDIKIVFTCNQTSDCMEAISALSLVNVVVKDDLLAALTYANRVNTELNNSTLASAISTAQGVYDNASATQAEVNSAIPTLNSAVAAAISEDSPSDISWVLANPGFEGCTVTTTNAAASSSAAPLNIAGEWTQSSSAAWSSSAVVAYGGAGQVNGASAPSADNAGNSGNTLGVSVGWGGLVTYQSPAILLPAGVYTLSINGYNAHTATQFASKFGFVPTTGDATLSTKNSFTASTWETDEVTFTLNENTEGKIQVGGQAVSEGSGSNAKVFFDNITIGYESPLAGAARLFNEKIDEAKAITDPHEAAIKTALAEAITTAEAFTSTTVEGYETAKAALQTAIDNSTTSINHYKNDLKPIIDKLKTYATDDLSAMDDDYNNGVYTSETDKAALIAQYQPIEIAALQAANATDYKSVIINHDFEFDAAAVQNPTGWTMTQHGKDDGTRNSTVTNMSSWYYNAYQEWWENKIDIKQTITGLPNGQYTIGATLAGWSGCTVDLTANGAKTWINGAGDGTGVAASTTCFVTDGTLNIKVNWGVREGGTFFKCDNFTLTYNGIKPMLAEALTQANAIKDSNVGDGAFQIPTAAGNAFNTAITTAQGVYDNDNATPSAVQTAYDDLNTAKTTYEAATVNSPVSGVQYRIKSTAADAASWKNKYYVLKKNSAQSHGGYSTQADVETTDAFYATAWEFVPVSGNQYKLRMTDADGAVRYLCTNIKGYDDGSATQIRTTTDADKALIVKVIAATGTDGRWFLQNTEDDSYLGGQDAGLYSNSQNYDLAIEAAAKASVTVNIPATQQYATAIFPFTPSLLPSGVKAYSCEEAPGNVLTLVVVGTPAANVPYILENTSTDVNETLQGWGSASEGTYTVGLLTGVYESTPAPDNVYVLANIDEKVAFYQVDNNSKPTIGAYRCYLTDPAAGARALYFPDEDATAISALKALTSGDATIYNANGAQIPSLQKGMNIIRMSNGTTHKVMVK